MIISFRRAEVAAFWVVVTLLSTAGAAIGARAVGASWWWSVVGLTLLAPGLLSTRWFEFGVAVWNKVIGLAVPVLRSYVLAVCYYLLFGVIRYAGSSLALDSNANRSGWVPRSNAQPPARVWTACLWPVLLLLTVLGDDAQQSGPPSGTYTLY